MTFTTVTLDVHDIGKVVIADYVNDNVQFVGIGTQAAGAIENRQAIHYVTQAGVETFIPFHAISSVEVTRTTMEATTPDDFCVGMDCYSHPLCPPANDPVAPGVNPITPEH